MIVITGSAGFIGSHVADHFGKESLLLVDNPEHFRERPYFDPGSLSLWDFATGQTDKALQHKVVDRAYFTRVLEKIGPAASAKTDAKENVLVPPGQKIDWVIHLGACTNTAETRLDFLEQWNVGYTRAIWNWCAKHKVPLVYASSGATYGGGEHGFSDSWETAAKLKPLNAYGQSKQDFDVWARAEIDAGRPAPPHWYGLKFFNVYGPREAHKGRMASAVLHSYREIIQKGTCRLFRSHNPKVMDGEQSRDFIHVKDIVSLIDHFVMKMPVSGLYNCGTGQARTFLALVGALFKSLDRPMKVEWMDTPEQFRKAYQYFTEADMNHTLASGYTTPFLSLEDGVRDYVTWLRKHERPEATFH